MNKINPIECTYCLKNSLKSTISLECSHLFCSKCLNYLKSRNQQNCPICLKVSTTLRENQENIEKSSESSLQQLSSKVESEIRDYKSQKQLIRLLNLLLKLSQTSPELYDTRNIELKKILSLVKNKEIFSLARLDEEINIHQKFNSLMIQQAVKLSNIVLNREMKIIENPSNCIWLGHQISIYSKVTESLNDFIKVTSMMPILIESIGVGLSSSSTSNFKYTELRIFYEKDSLVSSYALNDTTPHKSHRLTKEFTFPEPLLLESGVNYRFLYIFEGDYPFIMSMKGEVKFKNYSFSSRGASITCYLRIKEVMN